MGWNDIRVNLIPEDRQLLAQLDPAARTASGQPLQVLSATKIPGVLASTCTASQICHYLEDQGFEVVQGGPHSLEASCKDVTVDIFVDDHDEFVFELLVTFRLSRHSPDRLVVWDQLIAQLASQFLFKLIDRSLQRLLSPTEFVHFLQTQPKWIDAETRYRWGEVQSTNVGSFEQAT